MSTEELSEAFERYFAVFPWGRLPPQAEGFDAGCGSGRWARFVVPRVGVLHCIDASAEALEVAKRNLAGLPRCRFHLASVDDLPLPDGSMDFGYSLGVLHHVPDTEAALASCVRKLRDGAPFLVYVYYALDNRPRWFWALWRLSDALRRSVARLPFRIRAALTDVIAATVYWPLARTSAVLERAGLAVDQLPLSFYRNRSFYTMRTDALDRFGTRLEKRFTALEIGRMMRGAGLTDIVFHTGEPYWCVVGIKRSGTHSPGA